MQVRRLLGSVCQEVSALPCLMSGKHSVVGGIPSYLVMWHKPLCNLDLADHFSVVS